MVLSWAVLLHRETTTTTLYGDLTCRKAQVPIGFVRQWSAMLESSFSKNNSPPLTSPYTHFRSTDVIHFRFADIFDGCLIFSCHTEVHLRCPFVMFNRLVSFYLALTRPIWWHLAQPRTCLYYLQCFTLLKPSCHSSLWFYLPCSSILALNKPLWIINASILPSWVPPDLMIITEVAVGGVGNQFI